ncbi:MAG: efflux RND transporter periplasmic adaptor subunit [Bacteroidales bacterium]|nr:efflux RND transporter periplasmic adaptor subunit [Bacteroidales bacterium]MDD3843866.1 efflux RND transporter periplasmic adaptor subunit [Bacteroidales bacterium]MDD4618011.1 efflux RND transporter periplasmic adaptor subunit [Bacteroidales bacterium]
MKKTQKILLYSSIPVVFVLAMLAYNTLFKSESAKIPETSQKQETGQKGRGSRALPVSVHIAQMMSREEGFLRVGNLVANERVDIVSEQSGRVISINFKEGQFVKKGDVLVKLNDDELQVQLTRAEFQLALLEERLERQRILLEKDAVSREDYDQVLTEFNVLKQDIEHLKIRIEKMLVRAPFDGVVGFRDISLGAFLQPNAKITTLVDIASLIVEVAIPEKYVGDKLNGSALTFNVEGMIDNFKAQVYAIDPQIDVNTRTIMIRARHRNTNYRLRPGMSAKVMLSTGEGELNVYVPNQSVVPDVSGRSVWVVENGKAKLVPVQTGNRTADMLEVLSGIAKGDTVITTGLMQLREGIDVIPSVHQMF